jgi:hypothetical protein
MELEDVIREIEEDQLFTRGITSKIFKSMLNQPSLVSVNSANAEKIESENGYYTFKINFPRPILDVDTMQLLTTSIPQANASIPNTAITFWYYRLSQYTGTTPSLNNLYCVRLLPSYYKPEFINNPLTYGFNKTFNSYTKLSEQLALSCVKDLGVDNLQLLKQNDPALSYTNFPILPNDITIAYNADYNKFQMTGNTTQFAFVEWSSAITYAIGNVVYKTVDAELRTYTSKVNANLNNNPASSPTQWRRTYNEIVVEWKDDTLYQKGDIVARTFEDVVALYRAKQDTFNNQPPNATYWQNYTGISPAPINYNYLITGYDDPNVVIRQGESFQMPYNPYYFYRTGERVYVDGRMFQAITETSIFTPANIDQRNITNALVYYQDTYRRRVANTPVQNWPIITPNPTNLPIWSQYQAYKVGDLVYYQSDCFRCIQDNTGTIISNSSYWRLNMFHPYDARNVNDFGGLKPANTVGIYNGYLYIANEDTSNVPPDADWTALAPVVWNNWNYDHNEEYDPTDIVYFNGRYYERNEATTNAYPPVPSWDSKTFYPANTLIRSGTKLFRCVVPNQGNQPQLLANTWSAGTTYEIGQTAVANNTSYTCQVKHLNLNPLNPVPDWLNTDAYVPFNIAFVPGVQSYRCTNPVGPSPTSPNGDIGNWQGIFGGNNISSVWAFSSNVYWQVLGDANWFGIDDLKGEISGLYGLSRRYDYVEQYENTELVNFPTGIGGQPFNPQPERLLNSILGFTWNGIFDPLALYRLPTNETSIGIVGRYITLYNRLRPVPTYDVVQVPVVLELEDGPTATATRTYTADGYANLVYSSIVNIYTNIVGGSTLDTLRNTNLIATTSMNCGNLGIAFHGNYIDTPLQRVAGDINQLTIELRDEVGEPFFLTNNAIMTATFKITYKDGNVRIEEPA